MDQMEILLQSLDLIVDSKIWPDRKPSDILRILMFTSNKGWLYTPTVNGEIQAVIGAYRIQDVTEESLKKIPLEESGNILYVPFVISMKKSLNLFLIIRESCKIYLEEHPEINEIVLEDKNNKIKRYKLSNLAEV